MECEHTFKIDRHKRQTDITFCFSIHVSCCMPKCYSTLWLHLWCLNGTYPYIIRKFPLFIVWPSYILFIKIKQLIWILSNFWGSFSNCLQNQNAVVMRIWYVALACRAYSVCSNDDPRLTLTYLTSESFCLVRHLNGIFLNCWSQSHYSQLKFLYNETMTIE